MVQIVQKPPTWQEALGAGLGQGLGTGLQQLSAIKLQQLLQQQQAAKSATGLQSLGFSPEQAQSISFMDPAIQREIVKQKLAAPQQQAYAAALGELLGMPQQQLPISQLQEQLQPSAQPMPQQADFRQTLGQLSPTQLMEALNLGTMAGKPSEQISVQPQLPAVGIPEKRAQLPSVTGRPLSAAGFTEKQATTLAKFALQKQQMTAKERAEAFKITKDERTQLRDKSRQAKQDLKDLNRLEELEETGKLDSPALNEFLTRSGLDIPALRSPESEEFQKISANFLRNARNYFGARVSNFEIEQFLKTIPSLSQSPEGRKRVVANLKSISQAANAYYDTMREIIAENNGIPPFDLSEQIDDRIDNKLDKISEQFRKNVSKPMPQQKLIHKIGTGVASGLGSLIGAPGALVGKVGSVLGAL